MLLIKILDNMSITGLLKGQTSLKVIIQIRRKVILLKIIWPETLYNIEAVGYPKFESDQILYMYKLKATA